MVVKRVKVAVKARRRGRQEGDGGTASCCPSRPAISPTKLVNFPALCFVELGIGELALDPANGANGDLPYDNMLHLPTHGHNDRGTR